MSTREYTEVIQFAVFSEGLHVLIPSVVDVALKESEVEDLEDAVQEIYGSEEAPAEEPPPVMAARLVKEGEETYTEAKRQVDQWEADRRYRWVFLQGQLSKARKVLKAMKAPTPADLPVRAERYRVRKFTRGEFLEAVGAASAVSRDRSERQEDGEERNNRLLQSTLLGLNVEEPGKPREERELPEDVKDLDHQVADVLIRRMLAAHSVSPELLSFLRGGGGDPRQRG